MIETPTNPGVGREPHPSYLCVPELVVALAAKLRVGRTVTIAEVERAIREELRETQGRIAATRACDRTRANGGVTLPASFWSTPREHAEIREELLAQELAAHRSSSRSVGELFDEELARCAALAGPGQVMSALVLVDGKRALQRVTELLGLADGRAMMSEVATHLKPDDFEHTATLRRLLRARLGRPDA